VTLDQIAQLDSAERAEVFRESGTRLGIASPVILEKDYWVCWSLGKLFVPEILEGLVFKGGTSLSKAYGLIRRFSEDVDLTIPLSALGIASPAEGASKKARIKEYERAKTRCAEQLGPDMTWQRPPVFGSFHIRIWLDAFERTMDACL
jgi:predicted nucleotidyltransferase component of viral defense system